MMYHLMLLDKKVLSLVVLLGILTSWVNAQSSSSYVERQLLCALDRAPCDTFGQQVKDALPDIIGKNCATCTQRQVGYARRIAKFIQTRYPLAWQALVEKYSPQPIQQDFTA